MPEDQMRYDLLAQQALRGVVRAALERVRVDGLPGEHHFYIAFDTTHPGSKLSDRLRRKYPEEMTVVLQHQFWGLEVRDDGFNVELSFDNIPEKLEVPFAAIRGFFDPHVQFGLQFEMEEANQNDTSKEDGAEGASGPKMAIVAKEAQEPDNQDTKPETEAKDEAPADAAAEAEADADETETGADETETGAAGSETGEADETNETKEEAKVVSLDAFRKN
ncbi:MAG: ClpXP protease specificity-enhancing factor SspB [Pseudomonadota bacterium]